MTEPFSTLLRCLRKDAKFTNAQLANRAEVPPSLISGLQTRKRRVGEFQARKIGRALHLQGEQLEAFVLRAVDTCTEKVLNESAPYPAELLNFLPKQLLQDGVSADAIDGIHVTVARGKPGNIQLFLIDGRQATLTTQLTLN